MDTRGDWEFNDCHEGSEWKEDVPLDLIEAYIDDQDYAIICCLDCGGLHCNCVKVHSIKRGGLLYQRAWESCSYQTSRDSRPEKLPECWPEMLLRSMTSQDPPSAGIILVPAGCKKESHQATLHEHESSERYQSCNIAVFGGVISLSPRLRPLAHPNSPKGPIAR